MEFTHSLIYDQTLDWTFDGLNFPEVMYLSQDAAALKLHC